MYDRDIRFRPIHTNTPVRVGPATYFLPDVYDKKLSGSYAPFNTTQTRTSAFENKNLAKNPSPNKYRIHFRKKRIIGGTTMQNKAARFKYKLASPRGLYPLVETTRVRGKVYLGVPPRGKISQVSTIPEKGVDGYIITNTGLVKIYHPPENRPVGPTSYYNPEGHNNYTTLKYKGNFWSFRTADRFTFKEDEGPGPADYSVSQTPVSEWQKFQDLLQSKIKAEAPLLRTNDILEQKLCREDPPGPACYSPFDPNTKKCEWGKLGTFTRSQRKDLYQLTDSPGPASYSDPRTALDKVGRPISMAQAPFNVGADRFQQPTNLNLPGPGDYSPHQTDMWDELQKKAHSKYSMGNAPFDSSALRNTTFTKPDTLCIPSPDWYYPKLQKKGDENKSSMFSSLTDRGSIMLTQSSPGPAAYSTIEPFKTVYNQRSHLNNKGSAFLSSAARLDPLKRSYTPDPTTYNIPASTLSDKGCIIGMICDRRQMEVTPGPADYKVHSKYAKSSVLGTFNATLRPPEKKLSIQDQLRMNKKLRCFSKSQFETGHCPIS